MYEIFLTMSVRPGNSGEEDTPELEFCGIMPIFVGLL